MKTTYILSTGSYLPSKQVFNKELTQFPPSAIALIAEKTGIESRFKADSNQFTSTLAIKAGKDCLTKIKFPADELDGVIVATSTPDRLIPATSTKVADSLGASHAFAFDINSVCSGSLYAMEVAKGLLLTGGAKNILVIGADTYSKILNNQDFSTFPYFGDGAGAILLTSDKPKERNAFGKLTKGIMQSDGKGYEIITIKAGGCELPYSKMKDKKEDYFTMNGRAVFEFATRAATESVQTLLQETGVAHDSISRVILHQANINIIKTVAKNLGLPSERFFTNLQKCGNTASASILIALDEYTKSKDFTNSGYIILCAFGGGLSWGATGIELPKNE